MSQESIYFTLGDLQDSHDRKAIKRELDALPGVRSVSIGCGSDHVAVDYDTTAVSPDRIRKCLEKLGCSVSDAGG